MVPVDHTTSPVDGTLGISLETTRPQRQLNTGRGLRVVPVLGRLIPGVLAFLGTAEFAINEPLNLVRGPANLVVMEVVEGIRGTDISRIFIWEVVSKCEKQPVSARCKRTIRNSLEVKVGLRGFKIDTNPFIIDLILDIGKQNESRDNATSAASLHACLDVAIPHIVGGRDDRANAAPRHSKQYTILVDGWLARCHPVCFIRVAEVFTNILDAVQAVELDI
jgi:hypothetical protein